MTVRYRADLTIRHFVVFDGQRYRVKRVTDLGGRRRFTVAMLELQGDVAPDAHFVPVGKTWQ